MANAREIAKRNVRRGFRKGVRLAAYVAAMVPLVSFMSCSPRSMKAPVLETTRSLAKAQQAVRTPALDTGISYLVNTSNCSYGEGFRLLEIKRRNAGNAPFLSALECVISRSADGPEWLRVIRPDSSRDAIFIGDRYYAPSSWIEIAAEGNTGARLIIVEGAGAKPKTVLVSGSADLASSLPGFFRK
jgi:hypothetical protein